MPRIAIPEVLNEDDVSLPAIVPYTRRVMESSVVKAKALIVIPGAYLIESGPPPPIRRAISTSSSPLRRRTSG